MTFGRNMAFPGEKLLRICCDCGLGPAGVGMFLLRLLSQEQCSFMIDELFLKEG